jgi:hypothetical protein
MQNVHFICVIVKYDPSVRKDVFGNNFYNKMFGPVVDVMSMELEKYITNFIYRVWQANFLF